MFEWYQLFQLQHFLDMGLTSKSFNVILGTRGLSSISVVQGHSTSILFEDQLLTINLNGKNPFRFADKAVFLDPNGDVYLGIYNAD